MPYLVCNPQIELKFTLPWFVVMIALVVILSSCDLNNGISTSTPILPPTSLYDWTWQSTETSLNLYDVFFIHAGNGWAVGASQTILATSNGGLTWPQTPTTGIIEDLKSVFFVDSDLGWLVGGSEINPMTGHVFISKMGGAYPTLQNSVDGSLNTLFFIDKNIGWAAGNHSVLLHSVDGGTSWASSKIGTDITIYDLHFLNPQSGWAGTELGGIYRTKDGTTWEKENTNTISSVRAIHFIDTLYAWACGDENTILRRELDSNGKVVWTRSAISDVFSSTAWNDLFFLDKFTGWIVGTEGMVYKTIDGGSTWERELTGTGNNLNAIYMTGSSTGWIVGDQGLILTYTP